jgi:hypothetical protein
MQSYIKNTVTSNGVLGSTITDCSMPNGSSGQYLVFDNYNTKAVFKDHDVYFEKDIIVKGKNLSTTLEQIEKRLNILHPNPELEARWDELRDLRNRYVELERELIEKEKMWNTLKK